MILGTGIDIEEIERFRSVTVSARIFSQNEQKYLQGKHVESMAGLFAAKEAVVKALGTGFRGFWPSEIEISHESMGKPYVILHGKAKSIAKKMLKNLTKNPRRRYRLCIDISISHNTTTAIAIAVVSYSH